MEKGKITNKMTEKMNFHYGVIAEIKLMLNYRKQSLLILEEHSK